jgi:PBP1b-binding outer membrane lipoprotein LpoB
VRPQTKIVAAVVAATVALAGCGGSGSVSPAAYVKSVCTAARDWKDAIQVAGARLQSGVSTKSLSQAKAEYVAFVGALVNATGQAASQLKAAGTPSVSNGSRISGTLVRIFSDAKGSLSHAASEASALPTSSVSAFAGAAQGVRTTIANSLAAMGNITPERNAQLHSAAARDSTCRALAAGQ